MKPATRQKLIETMEAWGREGVEVLEGVQPLKVLISIGMANELDKLRVVLFKELEQESQVRIGKVGRKKLDLPSVYYLKKALNRGTKLNALAKELGCSRQTIRNRLKKSG
jgi:hypothetical protein